MITREMRFKKDFILEKIEDIKLKELRIGNYVYCLSDDAKTLEFVEISEIHDDMVYFKECDFDGTIGGSCYPIKLTEEWLIKLGFTNDNNESWFWSFDFDDKQETFKVFPLTAGGDPMGLWGIVGCPQLVKKIKFVHQLQNLFFALIGEELELK